MIDKEDAQAVIHQLNDILKTVFGRDCCYLLLINMEGSDEVNVVCTMLPEIASLCMHHMADRIDEGAGQIYLNQKPS